MDVFEHLFDSPAGATSTPAPAGAVAGRPWSWWRAGRKLSAVPGTIPGGASLRHP